ncbi:MAG: hypothetical protein M3O30_18340 [Planctomycetota bacterium]|nr:hypothetical protein [Planctomycetota bacterium]
MSGVKRERARLGDNPQPGRRYGDEIVLATDIISPVASVTSRLLVSYGSWLSEFFAHGSIHNFSATGLPVEMQKRYSLRLEPWPDTSSQEQLSPQGSARTVVGLGSAFECVEDLQALESWLKEPAQPLLVIGPFGSGKSGLLGLATAWLADRLVRNPRRAAVPLPVRLRDWRRHSDWLKFLHASQNSFTPYPRADLLSLRQIKELIQGGRLVPLYDGLDELPETSDRYGHSQQQTLELILSGKSIRRFVLSSRPHTLADKRIGSSAARFTIRKLEPERVRECVAARLSSGPEANHGGVEAYDSLNATAKSLLDRPLFLEAWITAVSRAVSGGGEPPQHIETLMRVLVHQCIEVVNQKQGKPRERLNPPVFERLIERLGQLLVVVSWPEREFKHTEMSDRFTEIYGHCPAELVETIGWARQLGLLVASGHGTMWALKIPVSEFLIGNYLARAVEGPPEGRKLFLNCFSRWIWNPATFETLDYAFDILGRKAAPLVIALIEWLSNVHSSTWECSPQASIEGDNLVRPFCFAALRFYATARLQDTALLERIARNCAEHENLLEELLPANLSPRMMIQLFTAAVNILKGMTGHPCSTEAVPQPPGGYSALDVYFMSGLQSMHQPEHVVGDPQNPVTWVSFILAIEERIPPYNADWLLRYLADRHNSAELSEEKWAWKIVLFTIYSRNSDWKSVTPGDQIASPVTQGADQPAEHDSLEELLFELSGAMNADKDETMGGWFVRFVKAIGQIRDFRAARVITILCSEFQTERSAYRTGKLEQAIRIAAERACPEEEWKVLSTLLRTNLVDIAMGVARGFSKATIVRVAAIEDSPLAPHVGESPARRLQFDARRCDDASLVLSASLAPDLIKDALALKADRIERTEEEFGPAQSAAEKSLLEALDLWDRVDPGEQDLCRKVLQVIAQAEAPLVVKAISRDLKAFHAVRIARQTLNRKINRYLSPFLSRPLGTRGGISLLNAGKQLIEKWGQEGSLPSMLPHARSE